MARARNLLILCTDEFRGDCLGANGLNRDVRTPHMDAICGRGVRLAKHFTTFPKCVPARVGLMTGRYAHTDGFRTIFAHLPADRPDVASLLKQQGYELALFGKSHCWEHALEASHTPPELGPNQAGLRFDYHSWTAPLRRHWDDAKANAEAPGERFQTGLAGDALAADMAPRRHRHWQDEAYAAQAIDFLENVRDRARPFFLQLNLEKPHPGYAVEEPWYSLYDRGAIEPFPRDLPENAPLPLRAQRAVRSGPGISARMLAEFQAVYYGMCGKVDALFGRVAEALSRQNLWDETVVLLWSDHGDFAGQYGLWEKWDTVFADCLLHVPCAIVTPGLAPGVYEGLSDHTDLAPTLCALLGVDPPPNVHGHDLTGALAGVAAPPREAVFADGGHEDEMLARIDPLPAGGPRVDKHEAFVAHPDQHVPRQVRADARAQARRPRSRRVGAVRPRRRPVRDAQPLAPRERPARGVAANRARPATPPGRVVAAHRPRPPAARPGLRLSRTSWTAPRAVELQS